MARTIRSRVAELQGQLAPGFELSINKDDAKDLEKMISRLMSMIASGAALALIVLLVFLRNWRAAFVVVLSIPTAILITFNAMYAAHVSINLLSLIGLAVGTGTLVDNSIVVLEKRFPPRAFHP